MKIGQSPEPASGAPAPAAKRPGPEAEAAAQAKTAALQPAPAASVSVSTLARTLEQSRRTEQGDVDQAKVDAVRASIEDGSYVVDAGAIADKMLADAQDMLQPRNRAA